MSVTREHTVWCDADDCVEWITFSGSTRVVRREARTLGWRFIGRKADLCPQHARELTDGRSDDHDREERLANRQEIRHALGEQEP